MDRMTLDQALFQRDGYQRAYEQCRAELDAARDRLAELHEAVRPALPYLDQHPGQGQGTADRLRELLAKADR